MSVLGAGAVGASCARALREGGAHVRVIDPGVGRAAASWAAAGILSPSHPESLPDPVHRLGARSLELWAELGALHPRIELRRTGLSLIGDDAAWRQWRLGRGMAVEASTWTPAGGGADLAALRFPEVATVRAPRVAPTLLGDIPVERTNGGRLADLRRESDVIVIATGAWAQPLLAEVGVSLEVAPRRGQMLLFDGGELDTVLMEADHPGVAVPRADGRIVVGTTLEDAGFDACTVAGDLDRLEAWARDRIPGLGAREDAWAGLRPWSSLPSPTIGHVASDVVVAVGHFRNGILLAPGTGELVADLVLGRPARVEAAALAPRPA